MVRIRNDLGTISTFPDLEGGVSGSGNELSERATSHLKTMASEHLKASVTKQLSDRTTLWRIEPLLESER